MVEFWGTDAATIIRLGETVELTQLVRDPESSGQSISFEASELRMLVESEVDWNGNSMIDISKTGGLVHARQALITDASFDWSEAQGYATEMTQVDLVRFGKKGEFATMAINVPSRLIIHLESGHQARLTEKIANGLGVLFEECRTTISPMEEKTPAE